MAATNRFIDVVRSFFQGGNKLAEALDGNLADILKHQRARHRGVIPSALLVFTANPANDDTIVIGGHTFTFKTTLIAATTYTQVKRLGSAALTLAALLDAINGVTNTNVVQATTEFAKTVVADAVTTNLRLRWADVRGGNAIPGVSGSIALAATITAGATAWDRLNLNASGKALGDQDYSVVRVVITAAMVTATAVTVELPFAIGSVLAQSNAGNLSWSGSTLTITIDDGHGNVLAADDELLAVAYA